RGDPARLIRHRQGWARRQGRAVLGLRRCPAGLGRLEDLGKRRQDLLSRKPSRRGARHTSVPRLRLSEQSRNRTSKGKFPCFAPVLALLPCCLSPAVFIPSLPRPPQRPPRLPPRRTPSRQR